MSTLTSLTSQRVLDDTMDLVRRHIPLKASGYRCQTADLWRVLLSAMTRTHSIEATCTALAGAPPPNTIRGYLARQWTPAAIPQLEAQSNAALRATIPAWVTTTAVEVAIDTHDCPFYGQIPEGDDTWWCGRTPSAVAGGMNCAGVCLHVSMCVTV